MTPRLDGIHHVTAIASDPQPNLDFYVRFLGLRLVKRTVNFDDPQTYHFYYGDETGTPGTILTFFPWPGASRGRHGNGQVTATTFAVSDGAFEFWQQRAQRLGVTVREISERFGQHVLRLQDPDGLVVELVESEAQDGEDSADVPSESAVQRIAAATLALPAAERTERLLTETLGFREIAREGDRVRYALGGSVVDLVVDPSARRGLQGAGTVHHIAFRTPDDEHQLAWSQTLMDLGHQVSPVMDRNYFHSIYFREPGGILFEIATDPPGFAVDEEAAELGTALKLPAEYEPMRERLESVLPVITVPTGGLLTESY